MYEGLYRVFGKIVAIIGAILALLPVGFVMYWFADANDPYNPPSIYVAPTGFIVMTGVFLLGIVVTYSGLFIYKRYRKLTPYFIKDGGPIHSGETWKKSSESGLFLTSCGIVLSINQESEATSHIGYKVVTAERTSCKDCALREGREIIQSGASGRDGA